MSLAHALAPVAIPRTGLFAVLQAAVARAEAAPVGLIGPGGNGKTWLACRLEPQSACFVDGVGARTRRDFLRELADGLRQATLNDEESAVRQLAGAAGQRLLVIDNCEQAVEEARWVIDSLVAHGARVAYTSRVALDCAGELAVAVDALSLDEALTLFHDGADPRVIDRERDAAVIRELVDRVERSPLGIEILAGHTLVASPAQILRRLDEATDLADVATARPDRHASLHAVVQSSLELAGPACADALRILGAIRGTWTAQDASALGVSQGVLTTLVRWSLVQREPSAEVVLLRVPARIRSALTEQPSLEERERLARWVCDQTENAPPEIGTSRRIAAIALLGSRFHELRAVVNDPTLPDSLRIRAAIAGGAYLSARHAVEAVAFLRPMEQVTPCDPLRWGRLAILRTQNLRRSGDLDAAVKLLKQTLDHVGDHPIRGLLLSERAFQMTASPDRIGSVAVAREAVAALEGSELAHLSCVAVLQLGICLRVTHSPEEAVEALERAITEAHRVDRTMIELLALCQLGQVDQCIDGERARALFEQAYALAELHDEDSHRAVVLSFHATRALLEDDLTHAIPLVERAGAGMRRVGQTRSPSNMASCLAMRLAEQREPEEARALLQADLAQVRGLQVRMYEGALLVGIGTTHHREGQLERARELYVQGLQMARQLQRTGDQRLAVNCLALVDAELGNPQQQAPEDPVVQAAVLTWQTGDPAPLQAALASAPKPSWYVDRHPVTLARRALDQRRPWVFGPDARAFSNPADESFDLGRRGAPRRILQVLVTHRLEQPGEALAGEALIEAGWPEERILPEAAQARLYTAIRTLRSLGLEPLIETVDDGYRLDPTAPVTRSTAP